MLKRTQADLISSVSAEHQLSLSLLEKDIHITDVLNELLTRRFDDAKLYLSGGICLSKAYELTNRMHEDIYLIATFDSKLASFDLRQLRLRNLQEKINECLQEMGFYFEKSEISSNNNVITTSASWLYKSIFTQDNRSNPNIKINIVARPPLLETQLVTLDYFYNRFFSDLPKSTKVVRCISASETLGERVISFLRHYAKYKVNPLTHSWDETSVRYIYDVCSIYKKQPSIMIDTKSILSLLLILDGLTLRPKTPSFKKIPINLIKEIIYNLKNDKSVTEQYKTKLTNRIPRATILKFDNCFSTFENVTNELITHLEKDLID